MASDRSVIFLLSTQNGSSSTIRASMESALGRPCRSVTIDRLLADEPPNDPACVVVDGDDGDIDLDRTVNEVSNGCGFPVVVVQRKPTVETAVSVIRRGACNYVGATSRAELLARSIAEALALDRRGHRLKLRDIRSRHRRLTPREQQVMDLVVAGLSNKAIADKLDVSVKTVEVHRSRVMRKMEATSLAALVRDAIVMETVEQLIAANA